MALSVYIPDEPDIVHETKVDFKQRCIQKPIHVVQYDKTMPIVKVKLEMNGYSYHIPANMDIYIRWGCPDHTFVVKPVLGKDEDHDDIIYFDVDEQMTYFHGQYSPILELRYSLGEGEYKLAGSSPIPFIIDRNPVQEHDIQSAARLLLSQVAYTGSYLDLKDAPGGTDGSATSLERLDNYLFKATFATIPEFEEGDSQIVEGACTSFVKDGKLYRNLDLYYDEAISFLVKCKDFEGMAYIPGVNDTGSLDYRKLKQLPYHLLDGRNNSGIRVSMHLLYNDWDYEGAGEKNVPVYTLPYHILSEVKSLTTAPALQNKLKNYLDNIKPLDNEYLLQFLVTDGTRTFIIVPPTSSSGSYQVIAATAGVEKLANFRYVGTATLARNASSLQTRPMGIERWNLIEDGYSLEQLRFTQAYVSPNRLSEFIGIDGTTKDSTDAELTEIYNEAHSRYLTRTRNGETWQTVYSIVYSADKIESLNIQENYNVDYISGKGGPSYTPGTYITISDDDIIDVDITKITTTAAFNQAVYNLGQAITDVESDLSSEVARATQRETELTGGINTLSEALNTEAQTRSQETTVLGNRMTAAEGDIDDINDLIPNAASTSNQLADKQFVNSSIQGSTANFRGNWATWSAVPSDYTLYPQDETGNKKPHASDYIVVVDASGYGDHSKVGTWRFKYSGEWDTAGTSGWNPEYQINDTPMTAAQLAALNSGATAALIGQISTNASNIATLLTDLTSVESRLSTAESDIASHGSRLSTVESGLSAANTNISNLISNGIGYTVESD